MVPSLFFSIFLEIKITICGRFLHNWLLFALSFCFFTGTILSLMLASGNQKGNLILCSLILCTTHCFLTCWFNLDLCGAFSWRWNSGILNIYFSMEQNWHMERQVLLRVISTRSLSRRRTLQGATISSRHVNISTAKSFV